jgi:Zn-dependent peptidase ImmA (M78 family)
MGKPEVEAAALIARLKITTPPIPVHELAALLGAQIVEERLDKDMSGLLFRQPGRIVIGLNETHPPVRQRFTIAHELGHLVLHPGTNVFLDRRVNFRDQTSSLAVDRDEIQANSFAAELLMPAEMVLAECQRASNLGTLMTSGFVADLATIFDVSSEAMGHRLTNLGIRSPL